MACEAAKYVEYARECLRLAEGADDEGKRDKLIDLARQWMDAATVEEEAAAAPASRAPDVPHVAAP